MTTYLDLRMFLVIIQTYMLNGLIYLLDNVVNIFEEFQCRRLIVAGENAKKIIYILHTYIQNKPITIALLTISAGLKGLNKPYVFHIRSYMLAKESYVTLLCYIITKTHQIETLFMAKYSHVECFEHWNEIVIMIKLPSQIKPYFKA